MRKASSLSLEVLCEDDEAEEREPAVAWLVTLEGVEWLQGTNKGRRARQRVLISLLAVSLCLPSTSHRHHCTAPALSPLYFCTLPNPTHLEKEKS